MMIAVVMVVGTLFTCFDAAALLLCGESALVWLIPLLSGARALVIMARITVLVPRIL